MTPYLIRVRETVAVFTVVQIRNDFWVQTGHRLRGVERAQWCERSDSTYCVFVCVAVWQCGSVAVWQCGSVAVWLCVCACGWLYEAVVWQCVAVGRSVNSRIREMRGRVDERANGWVSVLVGGSWWARAQHSTALYLWCHGADNVRVGGNRLQEGNVLV